MSEKICFTAFEMNEGMVTTGGWNQVMPNEHSKCILMLAPWNFVSLGPFLKQLVNLTIFDFVKWTQLRCLSVLPYENEISFIASLGKKNLSEK